jgi:hypothetical protein
LTSIVLQHPSDGLEEEDSTDVQKMMSARDAHKAILELGRIIPRRESVSASHDIVWECRMCQSDETCFFCHSCWEEEGQPCGS